MFHFPMVPACGCFGWLLPAAGFIFSVWMLVDCLVNESSQGNDKLVWAVVIILMPCLGPILYFFIRRPARKSQLGR
jgi:hypothetical protein